MFSDSKRLSETRTDFCLWLNIRKLISMFRSVWMYFSIFFLSFFGFSWLHWGGEMPEIPRDTLTNQTGSPAAIAARRAFFQTTPELWTFKSFTDPFHAETKPHPWLTLASRGAVESLAQQSSSAQPGCFANAAPVTQGCCGFICLQRNCQTLFVLDAVNDRAAKQKLGTH